MYIAQILVNLKRCFALYFFFTPLDAFDTEKMTFFVHLFIIIIVLFIFLEKERKVCSLKVCLFFVF